MLLLSLSLLPSAVGSRNHELTGVSTTTTIRGPDVAPVIATLSSTSTPEPPNSTLTALGISDSSTTTALESLNTSDRVSDVISLSSSTYCSFCGTGPSSAVSTTVSDSTPVTQHELETITTLGTVLDDLATFSSSSISTIFTSLSPFSSVYGPPQATSGGDQPLFGVCFNAVEGKVDYTAQLGCNRTRDRIMSCYNDAAPWSDPYNTTQSLEFQSCMCKTSAEKPFNDGNQFYIEFINCLHCLDLSSTINIGFQEGEVSRVETFCRTQNPVAYLFLVKIQEWLKHWRPALVTSDPLFTGSITWISELSTLCTTDPPLANTAYGASAPPGGRYGEVAPLLTTYTTLNNSATEIITSLVQWLPTRIGGTWNPASASASQEHAESSVVESALCMGRGPCVLSSGSRRKLPRDLMWGCAAVVVASAVVCAQVM